MATEKHVVIGSRRIAGVAKGGTVDLDPAEYNIPALVAAGHIQPVSKPKATPKEGS